MKGLMDSLKIILVIVIIAAGAAALLAVVKMATAEAIKTSELAEEKKGVALVLPEGAEVDIDAKQPMTAGDKELVLYPGFKDGALVGVAVKTFSDTGYSGRIGLLVGFSGLDSPENIKVTRIYVLQHAETPGLGAKISDCQNEAKAEACPGDTFWTRYRERPIDPSVLKVTKDGGQIEAITSATISSRAITGAVLEAGEYVKANLPAVNGAFAAGGKEVTK